LAAEGYPGFGNPRRLPDTRRCPLARNDGFLDWSALAAHVTATAHDGPVHEFEAAVEAVINGDLAVEAALRRNPTFVHARSSRVHGGALLCYVPIARKRPRMRSQWPGPSYSDPSRILRKRYSDTKAKT